MTHSAKYLIHADIRASGVVERSDVVGAIFGQTEGLLGDGLDLRDLQEASKVGRIDVSIESEGGRTFGTITIASRLGKAETAVLGAALETIERVGPCRAECTITHIEDARAAKRRELVDRATELLAELDETTLSSDDLVDEVRQQARVEDITEYEGLPAGSRVTESDAIVVVEGRADVRNLLQYGIRNVIAVEGTDIPDAVARLTTERTTTAFLDGDRGGDLILRELTQVGDVDYVAFAPGGESVEDLDRSGIRSALRKKIPYEQVGEGQTARETFDPPETPIPDGSIATETVPDDTSASSEETLPTERAVTAADAESTPTDQTAIEELTRDDATADVPSTGESGAERRATEPEPTTAETAAESAGTGNDSPDQTTPQTLAGHVQAIIGEKSDSARLLDESYGVVAESNADGVCETIADTETEPWTAVIDGPVTQQVLDVAAQRGLTQVVGKTAGGFVKQPTSVRVRTADDVLNAA